MDEAANGTMFPVGFKKPIPVAPEGEAGNRLD